jgi:hypothetical protein
MQRWREPLLTQSLRAWLLFKFLCFQARLWAAKKRRMLQRAAAWQALSEWAIYLIRVRCSKAFVPVQIQMEAAGAEVHARELEQRGRKRGRRGLSEPSRLGREEKRELLDRFEEILRQSSVAYFEVAQRRCDAAREWYEHVANLYTQARENETVLELGPGGHLLDHKYQITARLSEPEYLKVDTSIESGAGAVFACFVQQLGRLAHRDTEAELRQRFNELLAYCRRLEDHNNQLTCQMLEVAERDQASTTWLS